MSRWESKTCITLLDIGGSLQSFDRALVCIVSTDLAVCAGDGYCEAIARTKPGELYTLFGREFRYVDLVDELWVSVGDKELSLIVFWGDDREACIQIVHKDDYVIRLYGSKGWLRGLVERAKEENV